MRCDKSELRAKLQRSERLELTSLCDCLNSRAYLQRERHTTCDADDVNLRHMRDPSASTQYTGVRTTVGEYVSSRLEAKIRQNNLIDSSADAAPRERLGSAYLASRLRCCRALRRDSDPASAVRSSVSRIEKRHCLCAVRGVDVLSCCSFPVSAGERRNHPSQAAEGGAGGSNLP